MIVLRAIGRFFGKIGRWIRDTAWVQPLLIVGGIFAIIFSIPKIVEWVDEMNEESNAAQTFFENKLISSQGKEDQLSVGSTLDKYLTALEGDYETKEEAYNAVNSVLKINSKRFFIIFVDESSTCDSLYTGLNYLKSNWKNAEFKDLEDSFAFRTIYVDAIDEYDESTKLFDDIYEHHSFENLAADCYNTLYADNKNFNENDDTHYESLTTSISAGTILYFNYNEYAANDERGAFDANIKTKGLRSCFTASDVAGSGEYERAQKLADAWGERQYSVFGLKYNESAD